MNKKLKVLSLAMSLCLVAPSVGFAAESSLDREISGLDSRISELEAEYEALDDSYKKVTKSSKAYIDKDGKYVSNKEAIQENLIETGLKLDDYVANTTPSLEQAMLGVYFANGAKGDGFNIRKENAQDLYDYLNNYFVMKDGKDADMYDALLRKYVNAISDSVVLVNLDDGGKLIYDARKEKKDELNLAKAKRKRLVRKRDAEKIKDLEKAVAEAKRTVAACKELMTLAPKKVAGVKDKLDNLIKDQEALIRAGEKLLKAYK